MDFVPGWRPKTAEASLPVGAPKDVKTFPSVIHGAPSSGNARRPFSFPRRFHLKRRKLIVSLFDRKRKDVFSEAYGCIRIVYRLLPTEQSNDSSPLQIGFSVGRKVGNAVTRNRIRRQMRATFQLQQHLLIDVLEERRFSIILMILYRKWHDDHPVSHDLTAVFHRLSANLAGVSSPVIAS